MVQFANAKLGRTLAVYASASFVVLQVIDLFQDRLELPDWTFSAALVMLLVGVPVVIVTALVEANDFKSRFLERSFTWKRSLALGSAAFLILTLTAGGYVASRQLGIGPAATLVSAGVLNEHDVVLLQNFEAAPQDSSLAMMFAEAVRLGLTESGRLRVASPQRVRDELTLMEKPRRTPVHGDVAKELALRIGAKALLGGSIARVGNGYILNLSLTEPGSGNILLGYRETANTAGDLIEAIDRVSRRARRKIGDSLKDLRNEPPLARATTSSLEALQRYTQAMTATNLYADQDRAVRLLEEAIAIDTTFASAHRLLATSLINRGDPISVAQSAIRKAYQHRERLASREKAAVVYTYYAYIEGEWCKAAETWENRLAVGDTNFNNIGFAYSNCARFDLAEKYLRLAAQVKNPGYQPFANLNAVLLNLGKTAAADSTAEKLHSLAPSNPRYQRMKAAVAMNREQHDSARYWSRELADFNTPSARAEGMRDLAHIELMSGRISAARRQLETLEKFQQERNVPGAALIARIDRVIVMASSGARDEAKRELAAALRDYPRAQFEPVDWPYQSIAYAQYLLDDYDAMKATADAALREELPATLKGAPTSTLQSRIFQAIGARDWQGVVTISADTAGITCYVCVLPFRARAFESLGAIDSAITNYEQVVTRQHSRKIMINALHLGEAYERLGALHEKRGDIASARKYYGKLVSLWENGEGLPKQRAASAARRLALLPES